MFKRMGKKTPTRSYLPVFFCLISFLFFCLLKKITKQKFSTESILSMPINLNILGYKWQQFNCFMSSWGWQLLEDKFPPVPNPGLWCSHSLASKKVWGLSRRPCRYWALVAPGNGSDSDKWESLEAKGRLEMLGVQWLKWIERKIKQCELPFGEQSLLD